MAAHRASTASFTSRDFGPSSAGTSVGFASMWTNARRRYAPMRSSTTTTSSARRWSSIRAVTYSPSRRDASPTCVGQPRTSGRAASAARANENRVCGSRLRTRRARQSPPVVRWGVQLCRPRGGMPREHDQRRVDIPHGGVAVAQPLLGIARLPDSWTKGSFGVPRQRLAAHLSALARSSSRAPSTATTRT